MSRRSLLSAAAVLGLVSTALAHAHHEELSEEEKNKPVDAILWIHIFLQMAVWGVLFPTGMVLGMSKSRWHVPLQVCSLRKALLLLQLKIFRAFIRASVSPSL